MRKLKNVLITLLLLFVLLAPIQAQEIDKEFEDRIWKTTGALLLDNQMVCSGFVLEPVIRGWRFITAGHCIAQRHNLWVTFASDLSGPYYAVDPNSVFVSKNDDIAMMTILGEDNFQVKYVELGDVNTIEPGTQIVNVAYPVALGKLKIYGQFIAPKFPAEADWLDDYKWRHAMPIDLAMTGGSSGSPIFDLTQKKVIGIVVGASRILGFAIPANKISEFLGNSEEKIIPSENSFTYIIAPDAITMPIVDFH